MRSQAPTNRHPRERFDLGRVRIVALLLASTVCFIAADGFAQDKSNPPGRREVQKGEVVSPLRSLAKPDQSYAVYLPKNYTPERSWPIVYVFDPDADGATPLALMKDAAERYGYLLAGSNNSRNGSWELEREAAQEMLNDTHRWLSVDDRRMYFAGLSGGARVAAQVAQICKCAHGVFLNGAGFPLDSPPSRQAMFSVFTTAGIFDFNYGELTQLDEQLETLGWRHFFQRFDGRHQWAPARIWQQALGWSTLLEMKDKLRAVDPTVIAAERARAVERLHEREQAGEALFAWEELRSMTAPLEGLTDTAALKDELAKLAIDPAVRAGAKQEKADIRRQSALESEILGRIQGIREGGGDQSAIAQEASDRIRALREDVHKEKRPERVRVLRRALGGVFVSTIETGESILDRGDAHTAARYFDLGAVAIPESSWPHFGLAKCHAILGDRKAALRDLKNAREAGATPAELQNFVRSVPQLSTLSDNPEYQKLLNAQ